MVSLTDLRWRIEYKMRYYRGGLNERLLTWLAWHLPRPLVMWCFVRVAAHATVGPYGDTNPSELSVMDALKRWDAPDPR